MNWKESKVAKLPAPTKAEQLVLDEIAELGCIVEVWGPEDEWGISNKQMCGRPASLHHPTKGAGMGQRNPHKDSLPLCPHHHQDGGRGEALHAGQETWEAKFGTEAFLLERRDELLGKYD